MPGQFEHGYALLIGVNESQAQRLALPDVSKDVAALQATLTDAQRCAYMETHVRVILGKDSSRSGILSGLKWLRDCIDKDADATVVIYYSGHGAVEKSAAAPAYYLIPYDVDPDSISMTALRADDFAKQVAAIKPRRLLAVLDCCQAGGMGVKGAAVVEDYASTAIPPGQLMGAEAGGISAAEGVKGLEALQRGQGRAVLSSSRGDQYSCMRADGKMSVFTYHLIEALTGYALAVENATDVWVSDLMSYVSRRVPESASQNCHVQQDPDYQVNGNFPVALLLGGKGVSKGMALPDPLEAVSREPLKPAVKQQVKMENVTGSNINIAAGDIVHNAPQIIGGDYVGRDKVDYNIRAVNSQVAAGPGAQAIYNGGPGGPSGARPAFCTQCGKALPTDPEAKFCANCGAKIN
jgi:hypothetical protein